MKTTARKSKTVDEANGQGTLAATPCSDAAIIDHLKKSDDEKYSPNLRAWLKKNANRYPGVETIVVMSDCDTPYIGYRYDGSFIGSNLNAVTCKGAKETTGSWVRSADWKEVKGFWTKYLKVGICATDKRHAWYDDRWKIITPKLRVCRYCGLTQKMMSKTHVVKTKSWETTKRVAAHQNNHYTPKTDV